MNWDAYAFFSEICENNRIARHGNFKMCRVSGLQGFEEAMSRLQDTESFFCVSEEGDGTINLSNTPHTNDVKVVFLAMRYPIDDEAARKDRFDKMRKLFNQCCTKLMDESIRIANNKMYLNTRIAFHEIDRYFFSGCACAWFQVATTNYEDMSYDRDDWTYDDPCYFSDVFNRTFA